MTHAQPIADRGAFDAALPDGEEIELAPKAGERPRSRSRSNLATARVVSVSPPTYVATERSRVAASEDDAYGWMHHEARARIRLSFKETEEWYLRISGSDRFATLYEVRAIETNWQP